MTTPTRYWGKHRGEVIDDRDPQKLGRVKVKVPAVLGDLNPWALPCTPYAGKGVGWFVIPPIGAKVWVEFEGGDPDFPIWTGCWWDRAEDLPGSEADQRGDPDLRVWYTPGVEVKFSHVKGKEMCRIRVAKPISDDILMLTMDKEGIVLDDAGKTVIHMTADEIRVDDQKKSIGTWTTSGITLENNNVKLTIDGSGTTGTLTDGTAKVELSRGTITASTGTSKAVLDASGVTLQRGAVEIAMTDAGIESSAGSTKIAQQVASLALSNGAAEVALTPASVTINKGALEVI